MLALATALAFVLSALAAAPAEARPAGAKWPWVVAQTVQANGKVSMRLEWKKIARAKKYRIDYAPLKGSLTSGEVQKSRKKKSKVVKGGPGKLKHGVVSNLKPGKVYCFQVYGVSGKTYGNRGGVHCKMATRANRRPAASTSPLVVGTYNTCSAACTTLAPWNQRRTGVRDRILQMRTAGRAADVVAIQEGNNAVPYFDGTSATELSKPAGSPAVNLPGFTKGCQNVDGAKGPNNTRLGIHNQALYVRTSTYDVIPGTAGGMDFKSLTGNYAQGACWVKVRNRATKHEVVVVSVHLASGSASVKTRQLGAVIDRINAKQNLKSTPKVFAGDFNSNASHTSRKADAPLSYMMARGYDSAYDMANRIENKPYYNSGGAGAVKAPTSWTWGDHVDRVYVAPGVHVASWKVDYRITGGRNVQRVADHNPIEALLLFPR